MYSAATTPHFSSAIARKVLLVALLSACAWGAAFLTFHEMQIWIALWFGLAACIGAVMDGAASAIAAISLNSIGLNLFLNIYEREKFGDLPSVFATVALIATAAFLGYAMERRRALEARLEELDAQFATTKVEFESQRADLGSFYELSLKLSSGVELQRIYQDVTEALAAIQHTDMAMLLVTNPVNGAWGIHSSCGFTQDQIASFHDFPGTFFPDDRRHVIRDLEEPGAYFPFMDAAIACRFASLSSTPITTAKGDCLGIFVAFFRSPNAPTEREIKLVDLYARQAANALGNARAYGGLVNTLNAEQRRTAVLRSLANASVKINSALSLDELLQTITDQARAIVGTQQAFATFTPSGQWTQSIHCVSLDESYGGKNTPRRDATWFVLASTLNRPIRVSSKQERGHPYWSLLQGSTDQRRAESWLAVPFLTADGRNLGLIQLSHKLNGEFSEDDEAIVVQLAQVASVAIENVRLYHEARNQITERTKAQEALERSRESIQLAQRTVGIGIWEWDLQRGILSWSDETCQLHEVAPIKFTGTCEDWIEAIHPDDREMVLKEISQTFTGIAEYRIEYRVLTPEGETRWLEARGRVLSMNDTPIRVLGVTLDITMRKRSEDALRKSEKLAAAGRLAASIAHEINNPLAAITNLLYLIRTEGGLDPQPLQYLRSAESELARVVHIAKQTLAFHRELASPVEVNIPELIDGVIGLYHGKAEALNLQIERQYSPTSSLFAYPNELRQVFSNLFLNAVEASDADGRIVIRVHERRGPGDVMGIRILIADHGPGIRPGNRLRIFEPFFTTKPDKGTGLGLWVTEGIVQKHGGRIRVRSRCVEESGTCFSLFLPYSTAQARGAAARNTHAA